MMKIGISVGYYRALCFTGLNRATFCRSRSNVIKLRFKKCTSVHLLQLFMQTTWAPQVGSAKVTFFRQALKIVQIIKIDPGTWYYPSVRLRCLYMSNLGYQAAGLQSWSAQWLAINRLGSVRRAHPEQRFPCGYGLWHRGTCPQPSALIWQMILYQRPLHWFGW